MKRLFQKRVKPEAAEGAKEPLGEVNMIVVYYTNAIMKLFCTTNKKCFKKGRQANS